MKRDLLIKAEEWINNKLNDFSIKKTYGVSPQNVHDDKPSDTAPPLKNRLSA